MSTTAVSHRAAGVRAAVVGLAERWRGQRSDRLRRTELDPDDLDAIRATGYPLLIVPRQYGGLWDGISTVNQIAESLDAVARVDPSLALVVSMHPAVLSYWLGAPVAPEPFTEVWEQQRAAFFATAIEGHLWGTVTSEPGSGGDIARTSTVAEPSAADGGTSHRLSGQKHFGSGFGLLSFMMTTARVPDEDGPDVFVLDLRHLAGEHPGDDPPVQITRPWDGSGMRATQSHAVSLDGVPATRAAWPFGALGAAPFAGIVMWSSWVSIVAAVIDEAVTEARKRLDGRRAELRPYEASEWVRTDLEHFQIRQIAAGRRRALDDVGDTVSADHGLADDQVAALALDALRSKLAVAELAESIMSRVSRVTGGGSFSAASPISSWYEDVRALGFLRPPWALGYDQLLAALLPE